MPDEVTLSTVVANQETIIAKLDAIMAELKSPGIDATAYSTNAVTDRTYVVAPWPPVAETTEDGGDDTGSEGAGAE